MIWFVLWFFKSPFKSKLKPLKIICVGTLNKPLKWLLFGPEKCPFWTFQCKTSKKFWKEKNLLWGSRTWHFSFYREICRILILHNWNMEFLVRKHKRFDLIFYLKSILILAILIWLEINFWMIDLIWFDWKSHFEWFSNTLNSPNLNLANSKLHFWSTQLKIQVHDTPIGEWHNLFDYRFYDHKITATVTNFRMIWEI
jgi:hypothetical protein